MIEIKEFKLIWKVVSHYQTITWWDKIKINILIKTLEYLNIYKSYLDISSYSKIKKIYFDFLDKWNNIYCFEIVVDVAFLGEEGIEVWLNNNKSRVKLVINTNKWDFSYFSNSIWNADYYSFYLRDHHLWVYTKWSSLDLSKLNEISQFNKYNNDIIFINRYKWNDSFIDMSTNFSSIFIQILEKIKNKHKYVIIDYNNWFKLKQINKKILNLNKYIKIYFYNFPFCYFYDFWENFINNNVLYNWIYRINKWYSKFWICNKCIYVDKCNNINNDYNDKYWLEDFKTF